MMTFSSIACAALLSLASAELAYGRQLQQQLSVLGTPSSAPVPGPAPAPSPATAPSATSGRKLQQSPVVAAVGSLLPAVVVPTPGPAPGPAPIALPSISGIVQGIVAPGRKLQQAAGALSVQNTVDSIIGTLSTGAGIAPTPGPAPAPAPFVSTLADLTGLEPGAVLPGRKLQEGSAAGSGDNISNAEVRSPVTSSESSSAPTPGPAPAPAPLPNLSSTVADLASRAGAVLPGRKLQQTPTPAPGPAPVPAPSGY